MEDAQERVGDVGVTLEPPLLEYECVPTDREMSVSVHFPMKGAVAPSTDTRPHMDFCIVIDHSGSMKDRSADGETKMSAANNAVCTILKLIPNGSNVMVSLFHSQVVPLVPLTAMTEDVREEMVQQVRAVLTAGIYMGGTNMSEALLHAQRAVLKTQRHTTVIFCSDGDPTQGLTDEAALIAAVVELWVNLPAVINTVGFGVDANAKLLRDIADATSGLFYHAMARDGLELALASIVGGAIETVATNVTLHYAITSGDAAIEDVHGGPVVGDCVNHGDIPEEATSVSSFRLAVGVGTTPIRLDVHLQGFTSSTGTAIDQTATAVISRTDDPLAATPNVEADAHGQRIRGAQAMEEAANAAEAGQYETAVGILQIAEEAIKASAAFVGGNPIAVHMAQLIAAERVRYSTPASFAESGGTSGTRAQVNAARRMRSAGSVCTPPPSILHPLNP